MQKRSHINPKPCKKHTQICRNQPQDCSQNHSKIDPGSSRTEQNVGKIDPKSFQIDSKSLREPLGRSWAIRSSSRMLPGHSGHGFGRSRGTPGTLSGGLRGLWGAPGTSRAGSGRSFRLAVSKRPFRGASGTIFEWFSDGFRELRPPLRCTGAVFREGRPFLVGMARPPQNQMKIGSKRSPEWAKWNAQRARWIQKVTSELPGPPKIEQSGRTRGPETLRVPKSSDSDGSGLPPPHLPNLGEQ